MAAKRSSPDTTIKLYAENQQSPYTARNARYRLGTFARWLARDYRITDLCKVQHCHLLAYKSTLAHLAPSTQACTVDTLRTFFKWCHDTRVIPFNPALGMKTPRPMKNHEPAYLSTQESQRLIASIKGRSTLARRDRAMLWTFCYGLRVGEVARLDADDLLPATKGRLPTLRVRGKGKRERTIPVCEGAFRALCQWLQARTTGPLFDCEYHGEGGRRMTTRAIQKRFGKLCRRAGIDREKSHPHAARHGAATRWIHETTAPGGIFTVSRLLGHEHLTTTQRYLHLDRSALDKAVLSDPLAGKRK